jgi:hypothetical protein
MYDNVDVPGSDGKRSHVVRQINEVEAAVVRRIFEMSKRGAGLTAIAKALNTEAAPSPRSQQQRPAAWAPSSVREVLYRSLYRGVVVWNQTRKRNPWGLVKQTARAAADWISVSQPELRIVSDELWNAVHERLDETRAAYLRGTKGELWGRPERSLDSKYLLTGLARCATCNGSLFVKSRSHGRRRQFFYGCSSFHKRGACVCENSVEVPMERSDDAVLTAIERHVLQPEIVSAAIGKALARLKRQAAAQSRTIDRDAVKQQLVAVDRELATLTAAITAGGELQTLVQAMREREGQRDILRRKIAALEAAGRVSAFDPAAV